MQPGQVPMGGPSGPMGPGGHPGPHMQHGQPQMSGGGHMQGQMHGLSGLGPQQGGPIPTLHPQSMHGPGTVAHHPQQQQQQHPPPPQEQPKLDNISKAKALIVPMKDSLQNVMKTAAQAIAINNMIDSGS